MFRQCDEFKSKNITHIQIKMYAPERVNAPHPSKKQQQNKQNVISNCKTLGLKCKCIFNKQNLFFTALNKMA